MIFKLQAFSKFQSWTYGVSISSLRFALPNSR
jgi:hypothetical protein